MKPIQLFTIQQALQAVGSPIAYYPTFAKVLGNIKAAIFLSQFMYWEGKQRDPDGWVYKDQGEIYKETGLSRTEQETARKVLKEAGVLFERRKEAPARLFYKFNWEKFNELVADWAEKYQAEEKPLQAAAPPPPPGGLNASKFIFKLKLAFDKAYTKAYPSHSYDWPKDTKDGKDWRNLALMRDYIRELHAKRTAAEELTNGRAVDYKEIKISDEEVLKSWVFMLENLPAYMIEKQFTPSLIYSNRNQLTTYLINKQRKTEGNRDGNKNSAYTPNARNFV